MEHFLIMLFLVNGPLSLKALRGLWNTYRLDWPEGSFEDFIGRLCAHPCHEVVFNGKGEAELTAEGAVYLRSSPLLDPLHRAMTHFNVTATETYRSFDSIRNEHIVAGALSTLVDKGILVPDDGQPSDVSDDLCESHRLGTGHA